MTSQPLESSPRDQSQYEFTVGQNKVIYDLAKKMRLVGKVLVIFGVIGATAGLLLITRNGLGALIQGVLNIFLGVWTVRGSYAFGRVVKTEGHDVDHLMEALTNLGKYFGLQYIIILIGLVLLGIFLCASARRIIVRCGGPVVQISRLLPKSGKGTSQIFEPIQELRRQAAKECVMIEEHHKKTLPAWVRWFFPPDQSPRPIG